MNTDFTYECRQIISLSADISLLTFAPCQENLDFIPGQYVEAVLGGARLPLSIANSPRPDGQVEFHLRHDDAHRLAQQFMRQVSLKTRIILQGPKGNCTLARSQQQKLIFLAGGTGFAPLKALLEQALVQARSTSLHLYWGIRRPQDAYDHKQLDQWQKNFSHFRYTLVLSEPQDFPNWMGPTGFVHDYVAKQINYFAQSGVFASGPFPMIKAAFVRFSALGLAQNQFISDMHEN